MSSSGRCMLVSRRVSTRVRPSRHGSCSVLRIWLYAHEHVLLDWALRPAPARHSAARNRRMVADASAAQARTATERSNRATMNSPCRRGGLTHAAGPASLTRSVDIWRRPYAPITRPGGAGRRPRPAPAAATTRSARALRRALSPLRGFRHRCSCAHAVVRA